MSLSTATQYCILSVGFLICTVMSKRATWGKEDLAAALNAIESSTSQRDAAKAFNIPCRTLQNYVQSGKMFKNLGRSSVLTAVQEKELCSRIVRFSDIGLQLQ